MSERPVHPPLLRIAHRPPVTIAPTASVREAARLMQESGVGAVAVVQDDRLLGILTERDLMIRVVCEWHNPDRTRVQDAMTTDVMTVTPETRRSQALDIMMHHHVRHLPVVDPERRVLGILSIRHLFRHQLERLKEQLDALEMYLCADGPGG